MRRAVIYFVLAALAGLVGAVSLSSELGSDVVTVDGLIVGTHTAKGSGANGGRRTVYYVDVERLDTLERDSVRNAKFYDAYQASGDTHVTLDILSDSDVERIADVHYLGHKYGATTRAEGIGVAIAFLVLAALFLVLGTRRVIVTRRTRSQSPIPPAPTAPLPPP